MYLISQLSILSGIPVKTLKYYEKYGLIKESQIAGKKNVYDEQTLERIELIEESKSIGLSLSDIKEFLKTWYSPATNSEKRISQLHSKIELLEEKVKKIQDIKSRLIILRGEMEKFV